MLHIIQETDVFRRVKACFDFIVLVLVQGVVNVVRQKQTCLKTGLFGRVKTFTKTCWFQFREAVSQGGKPRSPSVASIPKEACFGNRKLSEGTLPATKAI